MAEMTKDELLEALFIAKTGNSIDGRIAANFAKRSVTVSSIRHFRVVTTADFTTPSIDSCGIMFESATSRKGKQMKNVIATLVLGLVLCVPAFADETLHHLTAEQTAATQALLSKFSCPDGAFPKACKSFQDLVAAGDTEILVPFLPGTLPPSKVLATTYIIFDDTTDTFWVFAAMGYNDSGLKMDLFFTFWQHGQLKIGRLGTVPFVEGKVVKFSEDGVSLEFNGDTLEASQSYTNTDNKKVEITISVKLSTLRTSTYWRVGTSTTLVDGVAVKYANN